MADIYLVDATQVESAAVDNIGNPGDAVIFFIPQPGSHRPPVTRVPDIGIGELNAMIVSGEVTIPS